MNRRKMFRQLARSVPRVHRVPMQAMLEDNDRAFGPVKESARILGRLGSVTVRRTYDSATDEAKFNLSVASTRRVRF